ncbi:MAG: glutamine synthetase [Alphaproteobacteria bacterium]|nr:glutamine synthetase [Alphaproteobacteria bacterium]
MTPEAANAAASAFRDQYRDIRVVDALIVDMCGVPRGKRLAIEALPRVLGGGMVLPGSTFVMDVRGNNVRGTGMGPEDGDPDYPIHPVTGTLKPIPWAPSPRAQVLMTMAGLDGTPFPYDPRVLLANVAKGFTNLGLTPVVAVELEFYLLDPQRTSDGGIRQAAAAGKRPTETQVYSLEELDAIAPFLDAVASGCALHDIPADVVVSEYSPGQYEINLKHVDDPLKAADHAVLLKRVIKGSAESHGMLATFMAKPFIDLPGNGTHIHLSLWDRDGHNIFDEGETGSPALRHAIGGLMATMAEAMAVFAPNANSYRRIRPGAWVPMAPTWGYNNRTVALRVPAGRGAATRLEHRVAGADANSYLVVAAVLAGALHGLARRIDPGPAMIGNVYDQVPASLPATWLDALRAHDGATVLPPAFGPDYWRVFGLCKRSELSDFNARITPSEYDWYLKLI